MKNLTRKSKKKSNTETQTDPIDNSTIYTQTDDELIVEKKVVETQTNVNKGVDQQTETHLTNLELSPDTEYHVSGFCKVLLKQFGEKELPHSHSHLRLFVYRSDEDSTEIAMQDYYDDYAATLATFEPGDLDVSDTGGIEDDELDSITNDSREIEEI